MKECRQKIIPLQIKSNQIKFKLRRTYKLQDFSPSIDHCRTTPSTGAIMTRLTAQILALLCMLLAWTSAQAVAFKWVDQQGNVHALADLKGKPTVLHLWASWCPPCQSELPDFAIWRNEHPNTQIVPVSLDNSFEEAADFIASKNITMPALLSDSSQARHLGIRGLPTTLIIAADGSITQHHLGPRDWHDPAFNLLLSKALHISKQAMVK